MLGEEPGVVVKVRSAGMPVCVNVIVAPASGSVAVAVIGVIATFSVAIAVGGAETVGGVFPLEERAPSASNQSPGMPFNVPQGSVGSPTTYVFGKKNPSHSVPNAVPNPKGLMVEAPI